MSRDPQPLEAFIKGDEITATLAAMEATTGHVPRIRHFGTMARDGAGLMARFKTGDKVYLVECEGRE